MMARKEIERVCGEVVAIAVEHSRLCITVKGFYGKTKCFAYPGSKLSPDVNVGDGITIEGTLRAIGEINIRSCVTWKICHLTKEDKR